MGKRAIGFTGSPWSKSTGPFGLQPIADVIVTHQRNHHSHSSQSKGFVRVGSIMHHASTQPVIMVLMYTNVNAGLLFIMATSLKFTASSLLAGLQIPHAFRAMRASAQMVSCKTRALPVVVDGFGSLNMTDIVMSHLACIR
jgi:hypothetical protein